MHSGLDTLHCRRFPSWWSAANWSPGWSGFIQYTGSRNISIELSASWFLCCWRSYGILWIFFRYACNNGYAYISAYLNSSMWLKFDTCFKNQICTILHYSSFIKPMYFVWQIVLITRGNIAFKYWPCIESSGGRLNKKDGLTRYGDSHVKDKTS